MPTDVNPADLATRSLKACDLKDSTWLTGPKFLHEQSSSEAPTNVPSNVAFELASEDPELHPKVKTFVTQAKPCNQESLGTSRFLCFSCWSKIVNIVGNLILVAQKRHHGHQHVWALDSNNPETKTSSTISVTEARVRVQKLIIRNLQNKAFQEELDCLEGKKNLPNNYFD